MTEKRKLVGNPNRAPRQDEKHNMLDINQDICATDRQGHPTIMIVSFNVAKS